MSTHDSGSEDDDERISLVGEPVEPDVYERQPVPPAERTRRGLLVGLAVGFVAILVLQIAIAFLASGETWERVAPVLSTAFSVVAGVLGFAGGYYFGGTKE